MVMVISPTPRSKWPCGRLCLNVPLCNTIMCHSTTCHSTMCHSEQSHQATVPQKPLQPIRPLSAAEDEESFCWRPWRQTGTCYEAAGHSPRAIMVHCVLLHILALHFLLPCTLGNTKTGEEGCRHEQYKPIIFQRDLGLSYYFLILHIKMS